LESVANSLPNDFARQRARPKNGPGAGLGCAGPLSLSVLLPEPKIIFPGEKMQHRSEGEVSDNDPSAAGPDTHVNFDAPAILRKWPSLNNLRRADGTGPYLLLDGSLDECIREFMAKPAPTRHLYVIQTSPQLPLVGAVSSEEIIAELARLREFL
jgi:hypothetical protein